ncbi:hypothetical protein ACIBEH_13695 [Nocardia salmonicida]|uniref:hypothetical protein n=1 Tax=Nocardia salmonicida TaxID=53431 RepID=UPI0037BDCC36
MKSVSAFLASVASATVVVPAAWFGLLTAFLRIGPRIGQTSRDGWASLALPRNSLPSKRIGAAERVVALRFADPSVIS